MKNSDVQRLIETMQDNLMKAAEMHSDKGYSIGTKERYEAFVKERNKTEDNTYGDSDE